MKLMILTQSLAMAAPWQRTAPALLVLVSLCCVSLSHGRIIPGLEIVSREVRELNSSFNGVTLSECTSPMSSDAQNSSPGIGRIVSRIGDAGSDWQSEDHSTSILQGKKWKRTVGKIAEWVLHTCAVLLAIFAVFYTVSCICACCIGLDLLAEIWRTLGGCEALRALLSYFVSAEQAVVASDGESSPLLAGPPRRPS